MADTALANLTASGALDGTELVYGTQSGGDVKITTAKIKTLAVGTPGAGKVLAGATPDFTATPTLGASGTLGTIAFGNATSGTITLSPVAGALGSVTLSLPAATDTLVGKATTDTLTNKTLTSPTLTTPALGVATATSLNGLTITSSTGTFTLTNGKTLSVSNTLTLAGTDSTTMTFPPTTGTVGYLGLPQNSKSAAYTTVLADAGGHILHPTADNNARTFTIDKNATVAYPIGTVLTFVNQINTVTIAIDTDTLTLMSAGTTGSRTLAANGIATALKVASTSWVISGTGLT